MNVHGFAVTPALRSKLIGWMTLGPFTSAGLVMLARSEGAQYPRIVADRLIRLERKAGHIVRAGRGWRWVRGHQ